MPQDSTLLNSIFNHLKWELPAVSAESKLTCAAFLMQAIYIWILPVGHTTALRNLIFFSLIILTLWAALKSEIKLHFPIAWAWGGYGAVATFSLFYAIDPGYSLSEIKTELIYGMLAFILGATWIRNNISLNRMVVLLLLGNIILVGYSIFQANLLFRGQETGPLGSINSAFGTFSTYLITVMPFMAAYTALNFRNGWLRWLLVILLIANLLALYNTISRAAVLALMAEIVVAAVIIIMYYLRSISRQRALMLGGLILVGVSSLTILFDIQMSRRMPGHVQETQNDEIAQDPRVTLLWPRAIENIITSPWQGGGFGRNAYKQRNPDVAATHPHHWHAHNVFLNKGVQMGLPGILAFAILLTALAWHIRPVRQLMTHQRDLALYSGAGVVMIAGVIAKNMTDDYFIRDNALLFWLLGGALAGTMSNWSETFNKKNS